MEPQNNGFNQPDLPLGQQNPTAWWQTEKEQLASSSAGVNNQPALTPSTPADDSIARIQTKVGSTIPQVASDADLIEDEWVAAVKKVIEEYQGDPYSQSKAMTLLRADYMKKRYNKDIKIPES
jgi:hypothetical protein